MADQVNIHGLNRYIPAEVRRKVRARSKQGCVICRGLLCDYEHIDPLFSDATEHDDSKICLLCPTHHAEKTRGTLSAAQVFAAYNKIQESEALSPYHQARLNGVLKLQLGNSLFEYMPSGACVLRYDGDPVISLTYKPDDIFGGAMPCLSGVIYDLDGGAVVTLTDNEIQLASDVVAP